MDIAFATNKLKRLFEEEGYTAKFDEAIVTAYRDMVQVILEAEDERDLYAVKSYRFEKLKGTRKHERSLRLNDQWRLIITIEKHDDGKYIYIISIEDYHK